MGTWRRISAFIFYLLINGGGRLESGPGITFSLSLCILPAAGLEGGLGPGAEAGAGLSIAFLVQSPTFALGGGTADLGPSVPALRPCFALREGGFGGGFVNFAMFCSH